jgi:DNA processing protein
VPDTDAAAAAQREALAGAELCAWLRLTLIPGVGGETRRVLLKSFGLPTAVFDASHAALAGVIGQALAETVLTHDARGGIDSALEWLAQPGNGLVTLADPDYPQALLDSADPPVLLYLKGRRDMLNRPMLAIVGSRNATAQGERDALAFARGLGEAGLCIVSGLALGIDAAAHRGALATDAGTVAIIGTGADRLYPARNADLAREIAQRGAILSEFPLGTPALANNFPRRNRIIAGMARGTLVVEAAPRSGSLITARLAAEAGREVFAIPGSIHSPQARGCHQLIRQGAKLVETVQDVLEELGAAMPVAPELPQSAADTGLNAIEARVFAALGVAACDIDTLSERSGLTAADLLAILLPMELGGRVAQLPGGLYQRLH